MILAAGRGERMRPLTDTRPKPLVEVRGRSLLEHAILRLRAAGITDLVVNLGYLGAQIPARLGDGTPLGVRIAYSDEGDPPLETGGGVLRALPLLGDAPFLLVNADVYSEYDFSALVSRAREWPDTDLAHLVLVPNPEHRPQGDFAQHAGRLRNQGAPRLTFSGLSVLHPALFDGCRDGRFPLAPLLRDAADAGRAGAECFDGLWSDVGTPERLAELEAALRDRH